MNFYVKYGSEKIFAQQDKGPQWQKKGVHMCLVRNRR